MFCLSKPMVHTIFFRGIKNSLQMTEVSQKIGRTEKYDSIYMCPMFSRILTLNPFLHKYSY